MIRVEWQGRGKGDDRNVLSHISYLRRCGAPISLVVYRSARTHLAEIQLRAAQAGPPLSLPLSCCSSIWSLGYSSAQLLLREAWKGWRSAAQQRLDTPPSSRACPMEAWGSDPSQQEALNRALSLMVLQAFPPNK